MANGSAMTHEGVKGSGSIVFVCDYFDFSTISGVFFILIFIISVTGNVFLLCVLVIYENLKHVTNMFVLNLALSDLVFAATLPFWAVYHLHHWVFGDFFCKFLTAAYFVGLYSSVILLTAMTVDRFTTVVLQWPSNRVWRKRCAIGACAAAWIISIVASLKDAVEITVENDNDIYYCEGSDEELGFYLQGSLLFFLPFAIIVFCYAAILKMVLQASMRKKHGTVVVVLCIVAAFFVCWGPYNIVLFIKPLYKPKGCEANQRMESAENICRILAYAHCCLNPLLYMLSQKLRRHLLHLLQCENVRRKTMERRSTGQSSSVFQNAGFITQNSTVVLELTHK